MIYNNFKMPGKIILLSAFCLFLSTCYVSYSQPEMVHLSLTGQKKSGRNTSMTVTWSAAGDNKQFVRYGLTSELGKTGKAQRIEFHETSVYRGVLRNLEKGKKYFYKCGSDATGWSPLYFFITEPENNSNTAFRAGIFGDTQNNTLNEEFQKTKCISELIQTYSPTFTLHMGDIVDNGSITSNWKGFLSVTQELNATVPLMPVLGNHDVNNEQGTGFQSPYKDYHDLFSLPGDEVNYSFTYKNVRFIGLFSGCAEAAAKVDQLKFKPGSPEYKWLDIELAKAEKNKEIRWIVVYMHYPVYSFGWSNIARWKESLSPLLERHRVDICLAGHRHVYERHYQMNKGVPVQNDSKSTYSAGGRTVFITNGTAGGNPTGLGGKDLPTMAFTPDEKMYSFTIMDISDDSITCRVFDQDNKLIDQFTIKK